MDGGKVKAVEETFLPS